MNNMDEKKHTVSIDVPEGYKLIDKGNGHYEVVKKEQTLPKTWEEFCETHPVKEGECFIGTFSNIIEVGRTRKGREDSHKHMLPNKETAEVFLALIQLIQLRNCYNGDWEPDWMDNEPKCTIVNDLNNLKKARTNISHVLVFKSEELRDQFFENFRDLIEIAKPLI